MADPRFYDNQGPFTLEKLCAKSSVRVPEGVDGARLVGDVASIEHAGPTHLAYSVGKAGGRALRASRAGCCFVDSSTDCEGLSYTIAIPCPSPALSFALAAQMFYPDSGLLQSWFGSPIDSTAKIADGVHLSPGVMVGPGAEIGEGTRIGANTVVGRGVAIGRNCEIGSNVSIACALIGDGVVILPGAQIGQPGFGFASGRHGHVKIPQLGRVIVQDGVEIGACTTIDRGALGDTVIGEGTKIDNQVQIGHNCRIGRHCVIVAQVGISGSCELGDFVVLGGQVGLADHVKIGDGARLAARSAMAPGELPGGQDYGGAPARPIQQWRRELATIAMLSRRPKRASNG